MNLNSVMALLLASGDAPFKSPAVEAAFYGVSFGLIIAMGVAAIAAIVLVMLTPANSEGIDALGGSSETFFGKNKGKSAEAKLKLGTMICLIILGVLAVIFFILQIPAIWRA